MFLGVAVATKFSSQGRIRRRTASSDAIGDEHHLNTGVRLNSTKICRLTLLIFAQKHKNKMTCGKNPQSRSDWEHLCFVDPDLHDLQMSPVDQMKFR